MNKCFFSSMLLLRFCFPFELAVAESKENLSVFPDSEIHGDIYAYFFDKYENKIGTVTNKFVVTLGAGNTKINIGASDPAIQGIEYGLIDGGSYVLINYEANCLVTEVAELVEGKVEKKKLDKPQKPVNDAMIFLNDGRVPEYGFGITPIWMAYCFGFSLTNTNDVIQMEPIFPLGRRGRDYRQKGGRADVSYAFHSAKSFFPESIIETIDVTRAKMDDISFQSANKIITNSVCDVVKWTNISNIDIPQKFYVTNYFLEDIGGGRVVFEGICVSFIEKKSSVQDSLQIPMSTYVSERRTSLVDPLKDFNYVTTNGLLMKKQDLLNTKSFNVRINEFSNYRYSNKSMIKIFIFSLIFILSIFLVAKIKNR
jgi:hypothetical protein